MQKNEINAILKGVNPSLLAKIEETMYTEEDRAALQNTIEVLIRDKAVQFDSLDDEYGKEFSRKMILLSDYLSPFVETEKDVSGLRVAKEDISSIVLDISRYSVLTGNEALNQYSTLLSDLVTKDSDFKHKLLSSAQSIETTFLDRGIKMS